MKKEILKELSRVYPNIINKKNIITGKQLAGSGLLLLNSLGDDKYNRNIQLTFELEHFQRLTKIKDFLDNYSLIDLYNITITNNWESNKEVILTLWGSILSSKLLLNQEQMSTMFINEYNKYITNRGVL